MRRDLDERRLCVWRLTNPTTASSVTFISKPAGARLLAARLDLRIICNSGSNGIGKLAGQPVDDVIHCLILLTAAGTGNPGRLPIETCRLRMHEQ